MLGLVWSLDVRHKLNTRHHSLVSSNERETRIDHYYQLAKLETITQLNIQGN